MFAGHAYLPFDPRGHLPLLSEDESRRLIMNSIDRTEWERMEILNCLTQNPKSISEVLRVLSMRVFGSADHRNLALAKARAHLRTLVEEGWIEAIGKRNGMIFARIR